MKPQGSIASMSDYATTRAKLPASFYYEIEQSNDPVTVYVNYMMLTYMYRGLYGELTHSEIRMFEGVIDDWEDQLQEYKAAPDFNRTQVKNKALIRFRNIKKHYNKVKYKSIAMSLEKTL